MYTVHRYTHVCLFVNVNQHNNETIKKQNRKNNLTEMMKKTVLQTTLYKVTDSKTSYTIEN